MPYKTAYQQRFLEALLEMRNCVAKTTGEQTTCTETSHLDQAAFQAAQERCTTQPAPIADSRQRSHSSRQKAGQCIAETAIQSERHQCNLSRLCGFFYFYLIS
jgi:hypothetical protein